MYFEENEFFILMKSSLSSIFFMDCAFGVTSKKPLSDTRSPSFFLMFGSRTYIVLALTFKSMIHLELVFD